MAIPGAAQSAIDELWVPEATEEQRTFYRNLLDEMKLGWQIEQYLADRREEAARKEMWEHRQAKVKHVNGGWGRLVAVVPATEYFREAYMADPTMKTDPFMDDGFLADYQRRNPALSDRFA